MPQIQSHSGGTLAFARALRAGDLVENLTATGRDPLGGQEYLDDQGQFV